jgi:hypothetical protein
MVEANERVAGRIEPLLDQFIALGHVIRVVGRAVNVDCRPLVGVEEVRAGLAGLQQKLAIRWEGAIRLVDQPEPLLLEL